MFKNVGIDFPITFGDYVSSPNRTMIVALDPKRNDLVNAKQNAEVPKTISLNSVFSLHSEGGRQNSRNSYWSFVSYISRTSFVYLTDVYKIYYQTNDASGKALVSNKDKEFVDSNRAPYQHNKLILEKEIEIIKPNRIITLGKDARNTVLRALDVPVENDDVLIVHGGIEFLFLPHISTTVTQSIKTIGDLYVGLGLLTNNEVISRIGFGLLANRPIEELLK